MSDKKDHPLDCRVMNCEDCAIACCQDCHNIWKSENGQDVSSPVVELADQKERLESTVESLKARVSAFEAATREALEVEDGMVVAVSWKKSQALADLLDETRTDAAPFISLDEAVKLARQAAILVNKTGDAPVLGSIVQTALQIVFQWRTPDRPTVLLADVEAAVREQAAESLGTDIKYDGYRESYAQSFTAAVLAKLRSC